MTAGRMTLLLTILLLIPCLAVLPFVLINWWNNKFHTRQENRKRIGWSEDIWGHLHNSVPNDFSTRLAGMSNPAIGAIIFGTRAIRYGFVYSTAQRPAFKMLSEIENLDEEKVRELLLQLQPQKSVK